VQQGDGGKIINIASTLSFHGGKIGPSYTASKSAVAGLTRARRSGLRSGQRERDRVGVLRCRQHGAAAGGVGAGGGDPGADSCGAVGGMREHAAAVFVVSRAAECVHGTVLAVDAG
jgi:2-deoxy-D-gluconate 3-dehydrogenase